MNKAIKHLVECHCVLPQYRTVNNPPYHRFSVFSEIDESDNVIVKHAQCPNCGVIHKVTDITKSIIQQGRDESNTIITVDDIKLSLPTNITKVLETYNVDIATWQQALFFVENSLWGSTLVLSSKIVDGVREAKILKILEGCLVKIETESGNLDFPKI